MRLEGVYIQLLLKTSMSAKDKGLNAVLKADGSVGHHQALRLEECKTGAI